MSRDRSSKKLQSDVHSDAGDAWPALVLSCNLAGASDFQPVTERQESGKEGFNPALSRFLEREERFRVNK
jgi:hypothetical protein